MRRFEDRIPEEPRRLAFDQAVLPDVIAVAGLDLPQRADGLGIGDEANARTLPVGRFDLVNERDQLIDTVAVGAERTGAAGSNVLKLSPCAQKSSVAAVVKAVRPLGLPDTRSGINAAVSCGPNRSATLLEPNHASRFTRASSRQDHRLRRLRHSVNLVRWKSASLPSSGKSVTSEREPVSSKSNWRRPRLDQRALRRRPLAGWSTRARDLPDRRALETVLV